MRQNDEAIAQQKELHNLALQRERLQLKVLEEQLIKQTEAHKTKMESEREVKLSTIFYLNCAHVLFCLIPP